MVGTETSHRLQRVRERGIEIPLIDHGFLSVLGAAEGGERPLKALERLPRLWIP